MPTDSYNRKIDYLRVSVTDRCNLRCTYCMPECGVSLKEHSEILSFEEICKIVRLSIGLGVNKIKITGGEPLVRNGLVQLLESISCLCGLKDLSLTTNGVLLKKYAAQLKSAGLKKLNISIDTLDAHKFQQITRYSRLLDVLDGIEESLAQGFFVKLNVVIMKGVNDDEILRFVKFAKERKIIVRFIELMPISDCGKRGEDLFISCEEVRERLNVIGRLTPIVACGLGNGPAEYYKIEEEAVTIGFISPISCKFCSDCNRLRLTADGLLMPCLANSEAFDLRKILRESTAEAEILDLINKAIFLKPKQHRLGLAGESPSFIMSRIGG